MTREVRIHPDAIEEAARAAAWYENQRPGVASEFLDTLDAALDLLSLGSIGSVALGGSSTRGDLRRIVLKRFPYDVIFIDRPDYAYVVAFAHHSRQPDYWRNRTLN